MPSKQRERGAVILGAGGHGRGVLETLRRAHPDRRFLGFIDDDPALAGVSIAGHPVLGGVDWLAANRDGVRWVYFGIGSSRARRAVAERVASLGLFAPPLVHPQAVLHGDVRLGEGSFVAAGVVIAHATTLGRRVLVNLNATVGHDVRLADDVSIGPGANLGGNVTVEEGAFLGLNATVIPGIAVGAWSHVGAAAAVLRPVAPRRKVLGNPARDLGPADS